LFTDHLYYGNTVIDWIIAAGYILASVIIGRVIYWLFKLISTKYAAKSKTKLDDILIDMIEEPITFMIVLFGFKYALRSLSFDVPTSRVIDYSFDFILTISVTWLVSRLYDALHEEYLVPIAEKTATDLDDHLLPIIRKGVIVVIWSLGILIALNNAGYDVTAVLAGLGIGGLAFALAVQATFGNILGGLLIYMDGHFKVGDRVQLNGTYQKIDGIVQDVGLRTTRVKTRYEGRIVNIPNTMFTQQEVINADSENGRQVFQVYKLDPDTSVEKLEAMMALLKCVINDNSHTQESVVTGVVRVSEVSIDLMHLYWIMPDSSNIKTKSEVYLEILRRMRAEEIKMTDRTGLRYNTDVLY